MVCLIPHSSLIMWYFYNWPKHPECAQSLHLTLCTRATHFRFVCHTITLITLSTHHSHTSVTDWLPALVKYDRVIYCTRHVFTARWAALAGTALYYSCLHTAYTHQARWSFDLSCGHRYATTCIHCTVKYAPCGVVSTPTPNTKGLRYMPVRLIALYSVLPCSYTSLIK
jgi:hypothetical protein